ncbi:MAG: hypothetical protein HY561_07870, partial [Gemmatimonadetes bacterium]|nr:hypothetical protein [Gemmatimonadota bacterium]
MSPLAFPWLATPPSAAAAALALHGASHFSWTRWEMHASVLVGCALFAGLYLAGIGPLRRRRQLGDPVAPWRPAAFLAG